MKKLQLAILATLTMAIVIFSTPVSMAQGVIFGTVQNSDFTNPAVGDLLWFGFLDNTDEEIRIEANVGAGYDGLNWFDDFQNYTTEAADNPYGFVYVNPSRGEAFHLSGSIPSNSFQENNIVLAAASVPATPVNVSGQVNSPTQIDILWDAAPGLTYHIYRRVGSNNGVYRRVDDPSGSLANPGVAGPSFSDLTSDGVSEYVYLLIAEDADGNYSAHSTPLTVDAAGAGCMCPCQGDLNCDGFQNAVDLNALMDVVFFNSGDTQDSGCPVTRSDLDCDGFTTSVDLNILIDYLFFGGSAPCNPCTP